MHTLKGFHCHWGSRHPLWTQWEWTLGRRLSPRFQPQESHGVVTMSAPTLGGLSGSKRLRWHAGDRSQHLAGGVYRLPDGDVGWQPPEL